MAEVSYATTLLVDGLLLALSWQSDHVGETAVTHLDATVFYLSRISVIICTSSWIDHIHLSKQQEPLC